MEYSKEDLMEAKKQIWGVGENMGTEESKKIWEENAQFWDNAMGDESNEFHREVVRPKVTELLSPNPADYILDIACGNGNYSSYLAQRGASVVAFDYSKKMIELAKRRQSQYAKQIEFCVADATDRKSILELKRNRAFTKAVSNMAIMDITDIEPLLMAVYELLQESGIFVFATQHPCFVTLTEKYMTPHSYYDIAIEGQPKEQIYYHRSIQDIFNLCFRAGFVIDGFYEECFKTNKEIPMVMIVRLKCGVSLKNLDSGDAEPSAPDKNKSAVKPQPVPVVSADAEILHLAGKKVAATGQISGDGFIVMKGSSFSPSETKSCQTWIKSLRAQLVADGKVKDCVFIEDIYFKSTSAAAACVTGGSANGNIMWLYSDGQSIKDKTANI
jgi:2-polyprenyl-3-methyl-5-hydroxy-6-metoxy-1,4-benzoquinol methylase